MRRWLFIYTNCFPTVPVMLNDILSTSVLALDKWIFPVPAEKYETFHDTCGHWLIPQLGFHCFLQIGKFRWESSSTFHCPQHLNNPAQIEDWSIYAQLFTGTWPETSENPTDVNILQRAVSSLGDELQKCLSWARGEESRDNPLSSMPAQMHWRAGKQ